MPFWRQGFAPPPRTCARLRVEAVPRAARGQLGDDGLVDQVGLDLVRGQLGRQGAVAVGHAVLAEHRDAHQPGLTTTIEPLAPGTAPRTSSRLRAGSRSITCRPLWVTRRAPMWPLIRTPFITRAG